MEMNARKERLNLDASIISNRENLRKRVKKDLDLDLYKQTVYEFYREKNVCIHSRSMSIWDTQKRKIKCDDENEKLDLPECAKNGDVAHKWSRKKRLRQKYNATACIV